MASKIITAFLAWVLILIGISRISMALALRRGSGWGWLAVAGLAAIILGVLILVHWPVSGLWAIGMFIAVEMIVTGWSYILVALTLKARSR